MLDSIRSRIMEWLAPGLLEQVDNHHIMLQANLDIHCCNLPGSPTIWEEAVANARALQDEQMSDKERAMSLIEALKRKGVIKPRERQEAQ